MSYLFAIDDKPASLDMMVAIGFGVARITKDKEIVYSETILLDPEPRLRDFEAMAAEAPNHDWRCVIWGPLWGATWQRQGPERWMKIEENQGFA